MNDKQMIIGVGVVLALLLGGLGYALIQKKTDTPNAENAQDRTGVQSTAGTNNPSSQDTGEAVDSAAGATITFTDQGFQPRTYRTKKDMTVTVKNDSSTRLQFASDNHPSHTEQPELNLSVLQPGESASFTPTKSGTWGFHDHINDRYGGTLVVEE